MSEQNRFIAIDLKSFYASVECAERNLNPLTTNLVVADPTRTEKTICLAVSPSLKALGIPGRPRLFEVVEAVKKINLERLKNAPGHTFSGESFDANALLSDPSLKLSYITAPPRMQLYMDYSTRINRIYLGYIAPEDMHVYSVDEVFLDVTHYLKTYEMTAHQLAIRMIRDVLRETSITATAGIGTNLYLCKIAMDIVAKHMPADEDGVRIAELDEMSYRTLLWNHRPLTDFWRIGKGYARKLAEKNMFTMGDIARCSLGGKEDFYNEDLLFQMFGINAELLIDHAWGIESCTMADIHSYVPEENSLSQGQVLSMGYSFSKARLVIREMADVLSLDLFKKGLVTSQLVLDVGYDIDNLNDPERRKNYHGPVSKDHYGRLVPKMVHGSRNLSHMTSSSSLIMEETAKLFDSIVDPALLVRRMYITATHVIRESEAKQRQTETYEQLDLFSDYHLDGPEGPSFTGESSKKEASTKSLRKKEEQEKKLQQAMLSIKDRYGKNAVLRGMNYLDGATLKERNSQIGGHKA